MMSGGGGGGSSSGGGYNSGRSGDSGDGTKESDCSQLFEQTVLNSPKPAVLSKLKEKDVLFLAMEGRSLVAKTNEEEIAGSITSRHLAKLIKCIEEGFGFIAIIVSISGGKCTVEIRPSETTK